MRTCLVVGLVAVMTSSLTGCGGNQGKAEALAQQMVDEMNAIGDNFEKGDKAALKANFTKLASLAKQAKDIKVTASQDKAVEEKFKPKLEAAQKRMMDGIQKATTSGKLTPAELMELGTEMQSLGQAMQQK